MESSKPAEKAAPCKMCCACPETKQLRDECIVMKGEAGCQSFIEAHKACLRKEGFEARF